MLNKIYALECEMKSGNWVIWKYGVFKDDLEKFAEVMDKSECKRWQIIEVEADE